MRVLVADDDLVYRNLMQGLLSQWDLEPVVVADGSEAMRVLQSPDAPELVILDWMMPEMDGFEVCQAVRSLPRLADRYILIMTGSRNKSDLKKVLVAGADNYLLKPFEPIDLQMHIRSAMRILRLQKELKNLQEQTGVAPAVER